MPPPNEIDAATRAEILRQAMEQLPHRRVLNPVVGPSLRRNIDYQAVSRGSFIVQELPDGALPVYDRDLDVDVVVAPEPIPAWCVVGAWASNPVTGFTGQVYEVTDRSVLFSTWRVPEHLTFIPREQLSAFVSLPGEPPPPRTAYERLLDDTYFT